MNDQQKLEAKIFLDLDQALRDLLNQHPARENPVVVMEVLAKRLRETLRDYTLNNQKEMRRLLGELFRPRL